ncbi:MAG: MarR family winged helix-turn-helix transcriptional regulator [Chloroflexota bacterium]
MSGQTINASIGILLVGVCRAHRNHAAELLARIGLYVGQEWILLRLREQEGGTQSALAEDCDVEGPTMSKALQRMQKAGLVARKEDATDARVSRIYLTEQGRALCDKVDEIWAELEQRTLADLSIEERILLRRLLLQVRSNLE